MRIHSWAFLAAALFCSFSADALAQRTPYSQPPVHVFGPPQPLSPMDQHGYRKRPPPGICAPLQLLNEVPLGHDADGGVTVPVKVNGQDMEFSLNSSWQATTISLAVADQAKIPTGTYHPRTNSVSEFLFQGAEVSSFEFGQIKSGPTILRTQPGLKWAGILGLDHLSSYDLDLDLGADRMRLYAPNFCAGKAIDWQTPVLGRVPLVSSDVILVRVNLDGQSVLAAINTSTPQSYVSQEIAEKRLHIKPGESDTVETDDTNLRKKSYRHTFGDLSFGDLQIQSPRITIIPFRKAFDGTEHPDLLVGTDILRKLHVYIAFQEGMMYVSPASAPETAATSASPPEPAHAAPQ